MTTKTYQHIDRNTLKKKVDAKETFNLWNVLSHEYFKPEMNIPGSMWIPVDHLEMKIEKLNINKNAEIVVYCGGTQCPQSKQAAEKLVELGYTNVYAYEGGIKEWQEAGYQFETLPEKPGGGCCCSH